MKEIRIETSRQEQIILPRTPPSASSPRRRQAELVLQLLSLPRVAIGPPHTGSPGPFAPGTPEESEKSPDKSTPGRGPKVPQECAPESQKSPKKESQTLTFGLFSDSFETPGRTLWALLGPCPGALFPDSFRTLPGFRARRPGRPCVGRGRSQA